MSDVKKDLDCAIEESQRAIDHISIHDTDYMIVAYHLGRALEMRCLQSRSIKDIERAIEVIQTFMHLVRLSYPEYVNALTSYDDLLCIQYQICRSMNDIYLTMSAYKSAFEI